MTRTTLADAKSSIIPTAINLRPTDSRFLLYLNSATQRLMNRGKWHGTYGRYAITVDSQLMTLPAEIDTIESINVCGYPVPIRSQWFEFLAMGYGTRDETAPRGCGLNECLLRGSSPTFKAISTASTLTAKCDVLSDVGRQILILGYDANNNWVRTLKSGVWSDGELLTLSQGLGSTTVTVFSRVTGIQMPTCMDGQFWMYEGDTVTGILIGKYQYWESNPSYKVYLIPFIGPTVTNVVVMAKLAFRPVKNDNDYLLIGNLAALQLGIMAVKSELEHNWGEANLLWNGGTMKDGSKRIGAIQELDSELDHHLGSGQQLGINLVGSSAGWGSVVETLI